MNRRQCIRAIQDKLGNRDLVYFGTRGADAETLLEIDQFKNVFSQIAPLHSVAVNEICLEMLTHERVDLNQYNIDYDTREEVSEFQNALLHTFNTSAAVIPYKPCALLASAWFPRSDRVLYLSIFHEKQAYFEHKPWVESELKKIGILTLPWKYYADAEINIIRESSRGYPLVLRTNRSDGGAGLSLISWPDEIEQRCPKHIDGFIAVADLLSPSVPLNIAACISPNGCITTHPASLQIIGPSICTTRMFGYCGNDFTAIKNLDKKVLDKMHAVTIEVGSWMSRNGYIGAFGIDFLLYDGSLYLTEINPRFQGSSLISALIDREMDRPDIFMDHISAFLGIDSVDRATLRDLVSEQPSMSHVVCHNTSRKPISVMDIKSDNLPTHCRLIPGSSVRLLEEAIIFEAVFRSSVTHTGMELLSGINDQIALITDRLTSFE